MGARRTCWGLSALALAAATTGCQPKPHATSTPAPSLSPTTAPAVATTQPDADSAAALARKAEEWAKMMEALRAKREAAATQPTTQPVQAKAAPASRPTTAPAVAEKSAPGSALVFTPPPATAPVIQIHAPTAAASQPAKPAPAPPKAVIQDVLAQRTQVAVQNAPRDPAAHLDNQLAKFLSGDQTPDLASLSPLPADDRETIAAVMDGLANYRAVLRAEPTALSSHKVRPLVDLADRLRTQADLSVTAPALCSAVRGYGNYEPLKTAFVEGRENRALLYCEVTGFASRNVESNLWETRLTQELVLYRGDAEAWKKKPDEITDHCRNKRHDFYTMNLIQLPASLPAGTYTLKVTVIDRIANRVAETMLPVTINRPDSGTTKP